MVRGPRPRLPYISAGLDSIFSVGISFDSRVLHGGSSHAVIGGFFVAFAIVVHVPVIAILVGGACCKFLDARYETGDSSHLRRRCLSFVRGPSWVESSGGRLH